MKNLIKKELKLGIYPAVYLFTLLSCLILVPNYPYCVGVLYFFFPLMITFNRYKETKDLEFSSSLPIKRTDIVKSRSFVIVFFEILQLLVAIPCAIISSLVLYPQGNIAGMDANFAFFGLTLIEYGVFNLIFMPLYFNSGYKTGLALVLGMIGFGVTSSIFEFGIGFIPVLKKSLDSLNPSTIGYRLLVLAIGLIFYSISFIIAYKISAKKFKKVDL